MKFNNKSHDLKCDLDQSVKLSHGLCTPSYDQKLMKILPRGRRLGADTKYKGKSHGLLL